MNYVDDFHGFFSLERRNGQSFDEKIRRTVVLRTPVALANEEIGHIGSMPNIGHATLRHEAYLIEHVEQIVRRLVDREYDRLAAFRQAFHAFNDRQGHE